MSLDCYLPAWQAAKNSPESVQYYTETEQRKSLWSLALSDDWTNGYQNCNLTIFCQLINDSSANLLSGTLQGSCRRSCYLPRPLTLLSSPLCSHPLSHSWVLEIAQDTIYRTGHVVNCAKPRSRLWAYFQLNTEWEIYCQSNYFFIKR